MRKAVLQWKFDIKLQALLTTNSNENVSFNALRARHDNSHCLTHT